MRKNIFNILLYIFVHFLCACSNQQNIKELSGHIYNWDTLQTDVRCYKSSLYKDVRVIVLDSMAPPLRGIVKIQECEKGLYILDGNNALYLFDNQGKYLRQIGRRGNGPGEYREISDFVVDPVHQSIYVLESKVQAIYVYDGVTGRFTNSMKLDDKEYRSRHLCYCDGYLFTDLYAKEKGDYLLRKVGRQRSEADEYFLNRSTDNLDWPHISGSSPFYLSGHGGFYFIPIFSQTIYEWKADGLQPFLTLKSQEWMDQQTVKRALENGWQELTVANRIYNLSSLIVNNRFIQFSCLQGNKLIYVCGDGELVKMRKVDLWIDDVLFAKEDDICLFARYGTTDFKGDYYYMQPWEVAAFWKQMKADKLPDCLKASSDNEQKLQEMNPILLYYTYR